MGRGRTKRLIDELVDLRAGGKPALAHFVRVHLVLSGIDPANYTEQTLDDSTTEGTLTEMILDFKRTSGVEGN